MRPAPARSPAPASEEPTYPAELTSIRFRSVGSKYDWVRPPSLGLIVRLATRPPTSFAITACPLSCMRVTRRRNG
jgi:hypothetical protein